MEKIVEAINKYTNGPKKDRINNLEQIKKLFRNPSAFKGFHQVNPKWIKIIHYVFSELFTDSSGPKPSKPIEIKMTISIIDELSKQIMLSPFYLEFDGIISDLIYLIEDKNLQIYEKNIQAIISQVSSCQYFTIGYDNILLFLKKISKQTIITYSCWFVFSKFLDFSQVGIQELYNHYSTKLMGSFDFRFPILYWVLANLSTSQSHLVDLLNSYFPILNERTYKCFDMSIKNPYMNDAEKYCHFHWKRDANSHLANFSHDKRALFDSNLQSRFIANKWTDEGFLHCISNVILYLCHNKIDKTTIIQSYLGYSLKQLEMFFIRSDNIASSDDDAVDVNLPWGLMRLFVNAFIFVKFSPTIEEIFDVNLKRANCPVTIFEDLCYKYLYNKLKWLIWPLKMCLVHQNSLDDLSLDQNVSQSQIKIINTIIENASGIELIQTLKYLMFFLDRFEQKNIDLLIQSFRLITSLWNKKFASISRKRFRVNNRCLCESLILETIEKIAKILYDRKHFIMDPTVTQTFMTSVKEKYLTNSYSFPPAFLSSIIYVNLTFPNAKFDFVHGSCVLPAYNLIFDVASGESVPESVRNLCLESLRDSVQHVFQYSHPVLFLRPEVIDNYKGDFLDKLLKIFPFAASRNDLLLSRIILDLNYDNETLKISALETLASALNNFSFTTQQKPSEILNSSSKRLKTCQSFQLTCQEVKTILTLPFLDLCNHFDVKSFIYKCININDCWEESMSQLHEDYESDKENLLESSTPDESNHVLNILKDYSRFIESKLDVFSKLLIHLNATNSLNNLDFIGEKIEQICQEFPRLMPSHINWLIRMCEILLDSLKFSASDVESKFGLISVLIRSLDCYREKVFTWNDTKFISDYAQAALALTISTRDLLANEEDHLGLLTSLSEFNLALSENCYDILNYEDTYYLTPFQVSILINLKKTDIFLQEGRQLKTQEIIKKIYLDCGIYFESFLEIFNFYTIYLMSDRDLDQYVSSSRIIFLFKEFLELWNQKTDYNFTFGGSCQNLSIPLLQRMFAAYERSTRKSLDLLSLIFSNVFLFFNNSSLLEGQVQQTMLHNYDIKCLDPILPHILYNVTVQFLLKQDDFIDISNLNWSGTFLMPWGSILSEFTYVIKAVHLYLSTVRICEFPKLSPKCHLMSILLFLCHNTGSDQVYTQILDLKPQITSLLKSPADIFDIFHLFLHKIECLEMVFDILLELIFPSKEGIYMSYANWMKFHEDDLPSYQLVLILISFGSELLKTFQKSIVIVEEQRELKALENWTMYATFVSNKMEKFLPTCSKQKFLSYITQTFEVCLFENLIVKTVQNPVLICLLIRKIGKFSQKLSKHLKESPYLASLTRLLLEVPFRINCPNLFQVCENLLKEIISCLPVRYEITKESVEYLNNLINKNIPWDIRKFYVEIFSAIGINRDYFSSKLNVYYPNQIDHQSWYFIDCLVKMKQPDYSQFPKVDFKFVLDPNELDYVTKLVSTKLSKKTEKYDGLLKMSRDLVSLELKITQDCKPVFNRNSLTLCVSKIIILLDRISMNSFHQSNTTACATLANLHNVKFLEEHVFDNDFIQYVKEFLPLLSVEHKEAIGRKRSPFKYADLQTILRTALENLTKENFKKIFLQCIEKTGLFTNDLIGIFIPLGIENDHVSDQLIQMIFIEVYSQIKLGENDYSDTMNSFNYFIENYTPYSSVLIRTLVTLQFHLQHVHKTKNKFDYHPLLSINWILLSEKSKDCLTSSETQFCLEHHWLDWSNKSLDCISFDDALFIKDWYKFCLEKKLPDQCTAVQIHLLNTRKSSEVEKFLSPVGESLICEQKSAAAHRLSEWNIPSDVNIQKIQYERLDDFIGDLYRINSCILHFTQLDMKTLLNRAKEDFVTRKVEHKSFHLFKFINNISSNINDDQYILWQSRNVDRKHFLDHERNILARFCYNLAAEMTDSDPISKLITKQTLILDDVADPLNPNDIPEYLQIYFNLSNLDAKVRQYDNVKLGIGIVLSTLEKSLDKLAKIKTNSDSRIKSTILNLLCNKMSNLAYQLDANQLKNLDAIIDEIILPEMNVINSFIAADKEHGDRYVEAVVKNWNILADFTDRNYQNYVNYLKSADCLYRETVLSHTRENVRIIEDGEKMPKSIIGRMLAKQSEIENQELTELKKMKIKNFELTMKAHCECLILAKDYGIKIYKFIHYWLFQPDPDSNFSVEKYLNKIPAEHLLNLFPQLLGKMCFLCENDQEDTETGQQLYSLLLRIIYEYPIETVLTVVSTINSDWDRDQKTVNKKSVFGARFNPSLMEKSLKAKKTESLFHEVLDMFSTLKNGEMKKTLEGIVETCKAYYEFANREVDRNKKVFSIDSNLLLATLQKRAIFQTLPVISLTTSTNDFIRGRAILNVRLETKYTILTGISQPKLIEILCSDGRKRKQLVKGRDDPKQDSVMQQIFTVANKILAKDFDKTSSTSESLITTYRVISLSSRSAVIEFVEDTMTLFDYLADNAKGAHVRYRPNDITPNDARKKLIESHMGGPSEKLKAYKGACQKLKPVFGYFFSEFFSNAESVILAKKNYGISLSVSSIIGYILGLGDRHPSNILIKTSTASLVHIDLGIAFEQGRYLSCPEIVPFRLTRDLVHALGPFGISTVFCKYGKQTLLSMMKSKDAIETLLQTLLDDPLFNWCLTREQLNQFEKKRAMQYNNEANISMSLSNQSIKSSIADKSVSNVSQQMAMNVIDKVRRKLQGFDHSGHGSIISEQSNFSVDAIIERLINIATSEQNLSKMFNGWQAYL